MVVARTIRSRPLCAALMALAGSCVLNAAATLRAAENNDAPALYNLISQAYSSGQKNVTIPAGTYHITPMDGQTEACLKFTGLKDFEINATGAVIINTDRKTRSFFFDQCANVTIQGGEYRHDPLPFSQGRVTAIGESRSSVDIQIPTGYPSDLDDPLYYFGPGKPRFFNLFDAEKRQWKPDTDDVWFKACERLSPTTFRFHLRSTLPADYPIQAGDLAAWRGAVVQDMILKNCRQMKVLDAVFSNASGFCVHEDGGDGGNFFRYKVTRGPAPQGAAELPLLSSNADAFHSSEMRHGPILDGCVFEYMNDDGVPIHGSYILIMQVNGSSMIAAALMADYCRPGDAFAFYDDNGALSGRAKVIHAETVASSSETGSTSELYRYFERGGHPVLLKIDFDQPVSAMVSGTAVNTSALGNGFVVRNCIIRNHRARGILIKASDGLIENCLVEGSTIDGIVLAPETRYWPEADYARHVLIRNNTIRNVGIWRLEGHFEAGALTLAEWRRGKYISSPQGHQDITIEHNTFEDNAGVNVLISSAENIVIRDNRFIRPMTKPSLRGTALGVPADSLFWITASSNIQFSDNKIMDRGRYAKSILTTGDSAQDVYDDKPFSITSATTRPAK